MHLIRHTLTKNTFTASLKKNLFHVLNVLIVETIISKLFFAKAFVLIAPNGKLHYSFRMQPL